MTRIASLLAVPLAIVLILGMGSGADARGKYNKHRKPRQTCETRIFQGEDTACFRDDGLGTFLFEKEVVDPLIVGEEQADGFTLQREPCGCQLSRRYDFICAPHGDAVIGSVDRRGRWIRGELLSEKGEQVKFLAKRIDVGTCLK
jgi:hypothetical protein